MDRVPPVVSRPTTSSSCKYVESFQAAALEARDTASARGHWQC